MKNTLIVLLLSILRTATAQDTIPIGQKIIAEKIHKGNLQIKSASKAYESAKADFNQSAAVFLPNITASHTGIITTNPLMAFGSKLNQEILTQADFNPSLLNNPRQIKNFSTVIELQQPLINMDGVYERKAAFFKTQAYALQTERTVEYIYFEANKAYMQLQLAYKALNVVKKANTTALANLKFVENYFEQGLLQKTDVLNAQIRVNEVENQLQQARSNVENVSDYLAFLMNEDVKGIYKPLENLDSSIAGEAFSNHISDSRKDIVAMEKSTKAYEKMVTAGKMALMPRLNAFVNYQMYDGNIFGTSAKGYLLGAQLSWNVFDGYKSLAKLQKAKAEYQKSELETVLYKKKSQLELEKTLRQLTDAENKITLTRRAWQQADEAYRIRSNRFAQGLEKTTDLLMAETLSHQKELEYLQAVFEYNVTKQYLQFLTI